MKTMIKISAFIILTLISNGCNSFTDVEPKGIITPKGTEDYNLILKNDDALTISKIVNSEIYLTTDQFDYSPYTSTPINNWDRAFIWEDQIYLRSEEYKLWDDTYNRIYSYNLIINEVLASIGRSQSLKQQLRAEALVSRAVEYLFLVNTFGNAYSKNAATDLGVPFISVADATQKVPPRSTVKQIYDRLIADVQGAIPHLTNLAKRKIKWRVSKEGAEGLLARIYYYKSDYSNALKYANKVLAVNNTLLDYNTVEKPLDTEIDKNPEEIFVRSTSEKVKYAPIAKKFLALFGPNDLRLSKKFETHRNKYYYLINTKYTNAGISVPELLLIKAECEARLGNLNQAVTALNTLRKKRFKTNGYVDFASNNKAEIITKILTERRLELCFRGLRWLDMKKQAKEGRMGTVVHKAFGKEYKLEPNSLKYTLQIPQKVIDFAPYIKQNPR